jgi:FlaA1/EpsC-like NDP-sugar epimerase
MQPKFVSQFERTFEIEQELYRYMHLASPPMIASLVILCVIFVINLAMMLFVGVIYANMAVFAMCVIVLFVLLLRYRLAVQAAQKRFAEDTNNKGVVTVTATLTDEELISESSDREEPVLILHSELTKVFVTKHYYMIQTAEKMVYVFKKDAFTVGKEEEFLPYVQQIIENNKHKRK